MKTNNSFNALLLSAIRCLSILTNMLSLAILARALSLESYGTYSAGNLIISVFTNATLLGMADASNFYFNQKTLNREDCLNTIFFLQLILGLGCAAVILLGQKAITDYFRNPLLQGIYWYIAFRPLMANLYTMLLTLQFSIGNARIAAIRKLLMAVIRLSSVLVTAYITQDVRTIFVAYLLFDTITNAYYLRTFRKAAFPIRPLRFRRELIRPILTFAVPMGIYVLMNSLSRDIDKLVIGRFSGPEQLAIYTNCGAPLPFDIVTSAFLTMVIPIMTRLVQREELERGLQLLRAYLSVGILSTVVFASASIILSEEMILFLYGKEYLVGQSVFVLYTFVDIAKFANISMVLSAKGKTKTLMAISLFMLGLNTVLNMVLYKVLGFFGPAIATVLITLLTTFILLKISAQILQSSLVRLLDLRLTGKLLISVLVMGIFSWGIRQYFAGLGIHYFFRLAGIGLFFCGSVMLLNKKEIICTFRALNQERLDRDVS